MDKRGNACAFQRLHTFSCPMIARYFFRPIPQMAIFYLAGGSWRGKIPVINFLQCCSAKPYFPYVGRNFHGKSCKKSAFESSESIILFYQVFKCCLIINISAILKTSIFLSELFILSTLVHPPEILIYLLN